jgi:spermidine synthase
LEIGLQIIGYTFILFICCLVCHSELYYRRPDPQHLTAFYLMLSIGGAVGGMFVSIIAPVLFAGFWEYHVGLLGCAAIIAGILFTERQSWLHRLRFPLTVVLIVLAALICYNPLQKIRNSVEMSRNFYGVLRVREAVDSDARVYGLMHGSIFHGMQWSSGPYHNRPTDYYTETSGVGLTMLNHPRRANRQPLRIGVIGLGIGTLAAYGKPGDFIKFYEIDPDVISIAHEQQYFTYLRDCQAQVEIVPGDARLSLERELSEGSPQNYDILVVDAFTSDAIPAHLLTKEAFEIYLAHLNNEGVLAIHITNRHLNLKPVLHTIANHFGLHEAVIESVKDSKVSMSATWTLLTQNTEFINNPAILSAKAKPGDMPDIRLWTDDYSNLYQVLQ